MNVITPLLCSFLENTSKQKQQLITISHEVHNIYLWTTQRPPRQAHRS